MTDPRDILSARLVADLVGPQTADERIPDRPLDRYLTGILYPEQSRFGAHEDDGGGDAGGGGGDDEAGDDSQLPLHQQFKPSSMGISFRICPNGGERSSVTMSLVATGGRYADVPMTDEERKEPGRRKTWARSTIRHEATVRVGADGSCTVDPVKLSGLEHVTLDAEAIPAGEGWLVTVSLVNRGRPQAGEPADTLALLQAGLEVRRPDGWQFDGRPGGSHIDDEDARTAALIYRDVQELAVGHTCSATWDVGEDSKVVSVRSTWVPQADVQIVAATGHQTLAEAIARVAPAGLQADALASGDPTATLGAVIEGYRLWIASQRARIPLLPAQHRDQATRQLDACECSAERMAAGVVRLATDPHAAAAFRLANRAISMQRRWSEPGRAFAWRPFQLAFILQTLDSIADPSSPDREVMDLLWFPTGGGKTEAYLGLIAFTIFLRRLRGRSRDEQGGVTCFMRYTLRLLTLQQFERAAALVCACELIRADAPALGDPDLRATAPISIGLWVGGGATPNSLELALATLADPYAASSPRQLTACPCCHGKVRWQATRDRTDIVVRCPNEACNLTRVIGTLPLVTVDELIYRRPPTLLIATVDKFAQLVRNRSSQVLLLPVTSPPPELIIQDELHLISGSLGSLAGAYEAAIDEVVRHESRPIKIVGSTATIRRAEDQVRGLFNRRVAQFPPPGIDASDSCFAVVEPDVPTRRYLAVTTAGRSAKFTLQAVMASLLQGATGIPEASRDGYWTLVAYFNALRELGGALPLVQDDVGASVRQYASRRREEPRWYGPPEELTSRVTQEAIRGLLDRLVRKTFREGPEAVDVLLATNMISVGVDVPRLGLMIVNGQPKTTAEYIQATSRVGRTAASPGLVVAILNNGKARDRSNFETFQARHGALYRGIEATSVTPFAPRARDRTLHAALVLLARHAIASLSDHPVDAPTHRVELDELAARISARIGAVDPEEYLAADKELAEIVRLWVLRAPELETYWNDRQPKSSLLMAAEQAKPSMLGRRSSVQAWPTPNSLRSVEPSMPIRLVEGLRNADA
ncbi:MAG: hypothetical protein K2Y26_13250 [Gemmatimonadaceae bacterium]|nr:hypothetical protein [Gemmatimonadaceae bacterium]